MSNYQGTYIFILVKGELKRLYHFIDIIQINLIPSVEIDSPDRSLTNVNKNDQNGKVACKNINFHSSLKPPTKAKTCPLKW